MLWKAAKAPLVGDFDIWMKRIEVADSRVHKSCLQQKIPPAQWATSYTPICKWGISTSNPSESMNSWIKDARDNLHTALLHATLVAKCMARQCGERREMYEDVTLPAGPNTHKVLGQTIEAGKKLLPVLPGSEKHFIVDDIWDVDLSPLDEPSCACREYVDTGLPCIHMAAPAYVHPPHKPGPSDLPDDLTENADPHY